MNPWQIKKKILLLLILPIFFILIFTLQDVLAGSSSNFRLKIITWCGCGNNIKEPGEQCDGVDLAGASCANQGYAGGILSCSVDCAFNTSACVSGGGGIAARHAASVTSIVFTGRAYLLSKVGVLKDGQLALTSIAGPDADFSLSLAGLSSGNYIFAVFGEDSQGRRSSLSVFPIALIQGAAAEIGGIFVSPTITIDKKEAKQGENVVISGQSAPNGEITIIVNSNQEFSGKTMADKNGAYSYNLDTASLDVGQYFVKSKSALNGEVSPFSQVISFKVGAKTVLAKPTGFQKGDLNSDGRINLVDFSVAAYWYNRPSPPVWADLNGDGKVSLIDFSIMAYYWTG